VAFGVRANNAGMATENTSLPPGVEIFRAGKHTDDAGNVHVFEPADIDAIAASYNPTLRQAPLVVGHPASDLPAYGWVARTAAADGDLGRVLKIDTTDVEPAFAEMVRLKRFPKRSASFYPPAHPSNPTPGKWYLRHVGFLGAQPPAVLGLKDIQFADDTSGTVSFSEALISPQPLSTQSTTNQESTMDEETRKKLEAAQAEAEKAKAAQADAEAKAKAAQEQLAQFAEQQRTDRHAANVSFAEGAVKAGKLLPKDKASAVAVLDMLGDAGPVEFAEGDATKKLSPTEFIKSLIDGAKPLVQFGEFAPAGGKTAKEMSDAELDAAAKRYAAEHNVSYSEALDKVVCFSS
jgi:hypothetical protein